mgnify:CR=1 FL=1
MSDNIIDFEELQKKMSPQKIIVGIVVIVLAIIIFSSYYQVDQQEEAVVLRFGKFLTTEGPGLHFKLPFGIDKNYNVPTKKRFTEEFGYRTRRAGIQTELSSGDYSDEYEMLTGDLNIVNVKWTIQYEISDPMQFLFNVEGRVYTQSRYGKRAIDIRGKTIRDISQSVINLLVGDRTIFGVIGKQRQEIEEEGKRLMNKLFQDFKFGVTVKQVKLQNIVPPKSVEAAFEDVNMAQQDAEKFINKGLEAYNNEIPKAKGIKERTIREAQGYATEKINKALGDIARFNKVYGEYKKNPEITRMRLYYEMYEKVFGNSDSVDLIDKTLKNFIPFKALKGKNGGSK